MSYIELSRLGQNHWWRYLLGVLVILLLHQVVGAIPLIALIGMVENDGVESTAFNVDLMVFDGIDPSIGFAAMMIMFPFGLLGLWLAIRFLHKRPFLSLLTPAPTVNWMRILQGAALFMVCIAVVGAVGLVLLNKDYQFTFQAEKFFPFLLVAVLLTPIQAMTEEVLIRGYLMQGLGLLMNKWVAALLSSMLFAALHWANPDVAENPLIAMLTLFSVGMFLALITLWSGSLELAIGVHTINNLSEFLLFAPKEAIEMNIPAVFTSTADTYSWSTLMQFLSAATLFCLIVFRSRQLKAAQQ